MLTTKQVLMYLGLYPATNGSSKLTRMARRILPVLFIVVILCAILGCSSFIIKFKYINMEATIFTFMVALVYVGLISVQAIAYFSRSDITALFEQLSEIYRASQYFNEFVDIF